MPTIAVMSPGAMGSAIGARLVQHGARVVTSLAGRSDASIARARRANMVDAPLADLAAADIILSIVPPQSAQAMAQAFAGAFASRSDAGSGAHAPLYVDCNACSPATKAAIADIVAGGGARMIDACIIGGPDDEGGPNVYAAGPHAPDARLLATLGLRWHELDAAIGAAAALKMCFAGINKGLFALGNMMRLAAAEAGVGAALTHELQARLPHVLDQLARGTPTIFPRAWRWAPEMREIAAFGADQSGAGDVFEGFARFYERLASDLAGEQKDFRTLSDAGG